MVEWCNFPFSTKQTIARIKAAPISEPYHHLNESDGLDAILKLVLTLTVV